MKKTTMALAAMMMCTAMPAMANHDMEKKLEWKTTYYMNQIDTNKDGSISKAEHESFGSKMFTDADDNGNGMISKSELMAEKKSEWEKMKAAMPKDMDDHD